jgi:hypothetical protein
VHVVVAVRIEDSALPRWRCEAELERDPGAVGQLASEVRRLHIASLVLEGAKG